MGENIVVCPNCEHKFNYNKVNGVTLVQIAQDIEARKRMRSKLTLDALELSDKGGIPFTVARKIVLDSLNDLARDVHTIIGFGTEVE